MSDYNISAYISILIGNLRNNETQESTGEALFSCFTFIEKLDLSINILSSTSISDLVKRKKEVNENLRKLCDNKKYLPQIKENFINNIYKNLHSQTKDDVIFRILTSIKNDASISFPKKQEFQKYYDEQNYLDFLYQSFLYAICRPNIQKQEKKINIVSFLEEVKNLCPLCHTPLIKILKTKTSNNYEIINIQNDESKRDLNENKIALCKKCANEYSIKPDLKKQELLLNIKTELIREQKIQEQILNLNLEE